MSCAACQRFDAAERAALEGRDMPPHKLGEGCVCVDWITPEESEAIERARILLREHREAAE